MQGNFSWRPTRQITHRLLTMLAVAALGTAVAWPSVAAALMIQGDTIILEPQDLIFLEAGQLVIVPGDTGLFVTRWPGDRPPRGEPKVPCNACTGVGGKCVDENNVELPTGRGGYGYCDCTDLSGSDRSHCEDGKDKYRRPILE
jgi:hypothetical protein